MRLYKSVSLFKVKQLEMDILTIFLKSSLKTEGKNKGKAPLKFKINYHGTWIPLGTGETTLLVAWNHKAQKVGRKDSNFQEINKRLAKKKVIISDIIEELVKNDIEVTQKIISEKFKEKVNIEINGIKPKVKPKKEVKKCAIKEPSTFWEVLEHYRTKSGNAKETIRKWKQIEGHLKSFRPDFDFKDITEQFYNDYCLDYLVNVPICDNTIDKHIAQIKSICTYSKRFSNISISSDYIDFKRMYKNPPRLALNWNEVKSIEKFKPLTGEQQQAKDMFLIACYTGLRWQNVSDLKPHNFIEESGQLYLNVVTYKNGNPLRFPLPSSVKKIIERYQREIPRSYNSDVNQEIQSVARACKLNDIVYVRRMYKKKVVETPFPKWQKVTMHVGRHSFACEFLRRNKHEGLTALKALSSLLNHSSTSVTEIYWNMISAEKDKMLLDTFN